MNAFKALCLILLCSNTYFRHQAVAQELEKERAKRGGEYDVTKALRGSGPETREELETTNRRLTTIKKTKTGVGGKKGPGVGGGGKGTASGAVESAPAGSTSTSDAAAASLDGAGGAAAIKKGSGGTVKTKFLLPRLYILGAQKGGSSSLYELMIAHPQFCGGDHKEPMFFKEDEFFKNGKDWYMSNYNDKKCKGKENTFFVDGSTMMHRMPGVMERMDQFFSDQMKDDLRFIVLLREPVSRDYSWYQHFTRWYLEDHGTFSGLKTLQEHADTNKGNHFTNLYTHGEYAQQLKAFLGMFRREQILIINSNLCFKDSPSVMRIIAKFLNVPFVSEWEKPFPHDDHLGNVDNAECVTKYVPKLDCSIRDELARWYEPKNKDLEQLIISTKDKAPPMEPPFAPFREDYKKSACVPSAREELNKIIKDSSAPSC